MANYLLVSFSASNLVPDDLSIVTLPRGQVDYLSHNWQEEDVWRSWRNMTKQKNEIANGMRLENASWRTWWKQRNKLKTVTPETLNWYVAFADTTRATLACARTGCRSQALLRFFVAQSDSSFGGSSKFPILC
jgi:hypothetical protein